MLKWKAQLISNRKVRVSKSGREAGAYPSANVVGPQTEFEHFAINHLRVEAPGLVFVARVAVAAQVQRWYDTNRARGIDTDYSNRHGRRGYPDCEGNTQQVPVQLERQRQPTKYDGTRRQATARLRAKTGEQYSWGRSPKKTLDTRGSMIL